MFRLALVFALVLGIDALAQAPVAVTISRPADRAVIRPELLGPGNTYPVAGRISGGVEPYTVTVNGARVSVNPDLRFLRDLRLTSGVNTITAKVTDGSGATAERKVTVTVRSSSGGDSGRDPRLWPARPLTRKRCAGPTLAFGKLVDLRVARITCARAARVVRSSQRDRGRACTPNRADGKFSRCRAAGFSCYSRFRGASRTQWACVRGKAAARWFIAY